MITNWPSYDWHETNLRNYVNLSPVALPGKKIGELDFKPLGGGSGMIGLPGDFTPPSRFVRATAFAKSARPTDTGEETIYEVFRVLDNFNVPLARPRAAARSRPQGHADLHHLDDRPRYEEPGDVLPHAAQPPRGRKVDLARIDFGGASDLIRVPLDKDRNQDYADVTPQKQ